MTKLVTEKPIAEHSFFDIPEDMQGYTLHPTKLAKYTEKQGQASYFIGVDWVLHGELALYVEPKLNKEAQETNYLKMLFDALKHPDVWAHTSNLFEIKFEDTPIEIRQEQDLLTPLLVVHFLGLMQQIVRKGLKKSYYRVEKNLVAKTKGKILVNQTIKKNVVKNDILKTYCSYDEFGFDSLENRLLKKALLFVQRYLPTIPQVGKDNTFIDNTLHYILPAFESVSGEIELHDIKHSKFNAFYKEYAEAIRLAKLILQRFGYNITKTTEQGKIKTPPFWIDMAKLFELYVLGLLKDDFGNLIEYHKRGNYGETDFLLKEPKMVIDAKYKVYYGEKFTGQEPWKRDNIAKDIRQLSGYARDTEILKVLDVQETEIVPCLIVYPNQNQILLRCEPITEFSKFYKLGVKLPCL